MLHHAIEKRWPGWTRVSLAVLVTALLTGSDPRKARADGVAAPIVFTQLPQDAPIGRDAAPCRSTLRASYGEGGRIVRLDPGESPRVLTEGFESACGLDVSFDGRRILFAARREQGDAWNIYEAGADGSEPRQITRDLGQCRSPAYQATLYTIVSTEPWYQIMFTSDVAGEWNDAGCRAATSLYTARLDGTGVRRITLNLSDDMDPFLARDGRVLLSSWQRMDLRRGGSGRVSLFGVNIDGTDYALLSADEGLRVKHMPCETSGGLVVFVEAEEIGWDGAGRLASVRVRRPLHSHRPIPADPGFLYHSPSPVPDGRVLVSRRPADGSGSHGLCVLDPETGAADPVFDSPEYHDVHARLLISRPEPDGRSSVVDETRYRTGRLYCLNVHLTDEENGPLMPPGTVRRVRFLEGVPPALEAGGVYTGGDDAPDVPPVLPRRFLGEVPVSSDGSFQVEIPADVPVQIQTLDEHGLALETCGWIWAKHREPRGCIGCHEDPELTPENRLVEAVTRPGMKLLLPPGKRRIVDFRRDVLPILEKKCSLAACHGGDETPLRLASEGAERGILPYRNLLGDREGDGEGDRSRAYVVPGEARASLLTRVLLGKDTSRARDESSRVDFQPRSPHPQGAEALTEDEKLTFFEWIDLGAPWSGPPPDHPGTGRHSLPPATEKKP